MEKIHRLIPRVLIVSVCVAVREDAWHRDWMVQYLTLNTMATRFVLEAVRGGFYDTDDEGDICVENEVWASDSCTSTGRGECEDGTGVIVCTCNQGFAGEQCESCDEAAGFHPDGMGSCTDDPCTPNPCIFLQAHPLHLHPLQLSAPSPPAAGR